MSNMKKTIRMTLIIVSLLVLAALAGIVVTHADGPAIWVEKCPTQHYELRIEQWERGYIIVSCVRQA